MKITNAYIISYFGTGDLAQQRRKFHDQQLTAIQAQGLHPVVLSMEYQPEDRRPGVTYIDHARVPPGAARNQLLEHFYASDQDWAVFCDNDSFIQQGGKYEPLGVSIVEWIRSHDLDELPLHAFFPIDGAASPYTAVLTESQERQEWIFRRGSTLRGCCFFLKNLRQHHGASPRFSGAFHRPDGSFVMGEDIGFGLGLMRDGFTVMQAASVVLAEKGRESSTWAESGDFRTQMQPEMKAILSQEYGIGLKAGRLDYSGFYSRHQVPREVRVSRDRSDMFHNLFA